MYVNDAFSRCLRLQLHVYGGVGVFSSLYCFPEVEVEWVDALSFKVGAFLKANLHPPHSAQKI